MMNKLGNVVRQLQEERARAVKEIGRLDAALAALNGSKGFRPTGRRQFSAAARARIAAAQRARWAKFRGNAEKATTVSPRKRTLSAAARNRIASAQRARRAKVKAPKEKKPAA